MEPETIVKPKGDDAVGSTGGRKFIVKDIITYVLDKDSIGIIVGFTRDACAKINWIHCDNPSFYYKHPDCNMIVPERNLRLITRAE